MLSGSIIVALLFPVAVTENVQVLAVIWGNPSLRTPSIILLTGLAFTDFSTGLITQPVYVVAKLVRLKILASRKDLNIVMEAMTIGCAVLFNSTSLLMITLMSIERWLHMTHRSLVTERRAYILIAAILFLPIPLAVYRVLFITMGTHLLPFDVYFISVLLLCLLVTSVAYFIVIRIVGHHQQQIQAHGLSHNFGQPLIDFAKYKRSVVPILYIMIVLYVGYLPMIVTLMALVFSQRSAVIMKISTVSIVLTFLYFCTYGE